MDLGHGSGSVMVRHLRLKMVNLQPIRKGGQTRLALKPQEMVASHDTLAAYSVTSFGNSTGTPNLQPSVGVLL